MFSMPSDFQLYSLYNSFFFSVTSQQSLSCRSYVRSTFSVLEKSYPFASKASTTSDLSKPILQS